MMTPKSFEHAIAQSLCTAHGPDAVLQIRMILSDYLKTCFAVKIVENPEQEKMLLELFRECVDE